MSQKCELVNQADTPIRGFFKANMQDFEIQQELLLETIDPGRALRLHINLVSASTPNHFWIVYSHHIWMLIYHNVNFAAQILNATFNHNFDPHVNSAEIVPSFVHQTTKMNALRCLRFLTVVVYIKSSETLLPQCTINRVNYNRWHS